MTEELNAYDLNRRLVRHLQERAEKHPRSLTPGGSRAGPTWWVEFDAVRDLVRGLACNGVRQISDLKPRKETRPPTPPDVLARNEDGGLVGFEVTELTDGDLNTLNVPRSKQRYAAMRQAKTSQERIRAIYEAGEQMRVWTPESVLEAVTRIVERKDAKPFAEDGERYAERWLVIHTDEPLLRFDHLVLALAKTFVTRQFDAAYIVMGYEPFSKTYPWRRLRVERAAGS